MTINDSPEVFRTGPAAAISGAALRIQTRSACLRVTSSCRRETLPSSGRMTANTSRIAAITQPMRSVRRSRGESARSEADKSSARAISAPGRHLDTALVSGAGRITGDQPGLPPLLPQLAAEAIERLHTGGGRLELQRAVAEGQRLEHRFGRGPVRLYERLQSQQEAARGLAGPYRGEALLHLPAGLV